METGDGWLLRLRVPGGAITADDLRVVSAVASRYGSGLVDITARANLQIRGVASDETGSAAEQLIAAGLVPADAGIDARRAVVASPLTGHDPMSASDVTPVVAAVVATLIADLDGTLPSKFGVVVDDAGSWSLGGVEADVRVRASVAGWTVHVRGIRPPIGLTSAPVHAALAAARLCVAHGARIDCIPEGSDAAFIANALGVAPAPAVRDADPRDRRMSRPPMFGHPASARMLGLIRHRDAGRRNLVAAPFLGRMDADAVLAIAEVAERYGAAVRLTPDHSIALCGVAIDDAPSALAAVKVLGLVVDPDDGRAMVSACVGNRGCASAQADTSAAALQLAATAARSRTHLSACAKCCGAPTRVRHLVADMSGEFR